MDDNLFYIPVTGTEDGGAADDKSTVTTGETEGKNTEATPKTLADVEKEWKAKVEALEAKSQKDLNALKSTLDSNFAKAQQAQQVKEQQWARDRQDLVKKLQDLEESGLDEEDKPKYLEKRAALERQQLEQERDQYKADADAQKQITATIAFFRERGIADSELVFDQGLGPLVESGWKAVGKLLEELKELKAKATPGEKSKEKSKGKEGDEATGVEAPDVITGATKGNAAKNFSWAAAIKRFGSPEDVYQAFEHGLIDQLPE
jgi:hypothetical protein